MQPWEAHVSSQLPPRSDRYQHLPAAKIPEQICCGFSADNRKEVVVDVTVVASGNRKEVVVVVVVVASGNVVVVVVVVLAILSEFND